MSYMTSALSENRAFRPDHYDLIMAGDEHPDIPEYGFGPGGPLVWDWDDSIGSGDFANFYEPQGVLIQEIQNQRPPSNDFSVAQPVAPPDVANHVAAAKVQPPNPPSAVPPRPPPLQPPAQSTPVQTGTKRKAESEPQSAVSATNASLNELPPRAAKRASNPNPPSTLDIAAPSANSHPDSRSAPTRNHSTHSVRSPAAEQEKDVFIPGTEKAERPTAEASMASIARKSAGGIKVRKITEAPKIPTTLPPGKVFPIQIGPELFRLSGASISSDAPSYFSQYFGDQLQSAGNAGNVKTLYIDRDPATFQDIALHLQGYYIPPRDSTHFVKLFADAQFYSLPRLMEQLFENEIFIRIGRRDFQIPRDLFSSPGDSPNYFSLGFAHFFTTPTEVFPGLDRRSLLRPPAIVPPAVASRSGDVFADLIHFLQGYPVSVRDEAHRADLLRDARYFHLKGLEQRLLAVDVRFNASRERTEIAIRLEDIRQSGISFRPDEPVSTTALPYTTESPDPSRLRPPPVSPAASATHGASNHDTPASVVSTSGATPPPTGYIQYARPYVDESAAELILETAGESASLDLRSLRADFTGTTRARVASLLQVIASKLNLPATVPLGLMLLRSGGGVAAQPVSPANSGLSGETVRVRIPPDAWVEVDGRAVEWDEEELVHGREQVRSERGDESIDDGDMGDVELASDGDTDPAVVRRLLRAGHGAAQWIIRRAQWRMRIERAEDMGRSGGAGLEVVLCAVKIEAITGERARNKGRSFLG